MATTRTHAFARPFDNQTVVLTRNGCDNPLRTANPFCSIKLASAPSSDHSLRKHVDVNTTRAAVAGLLLLLSIPLMAQSSSTTMGVSVTVVARAVVTVENQPSSVNVSSADIERGFVEVAEPILIRVRTNSRSGYVLQADKSHGSAFSEIALSGETASLTVSSHETWLQRPYAAAGDVLSMRARVYLASGVAPGTHPLPLSFSATPL